MPAPAATRTAATEQALRHLAGVLLHTPTARAHELAAAGRADEFAAALETLFGVAPAAPAAAASVPRLDVAG